MRRLLAFIYGLIAYFFFFGTFLYAIGFITGWFVPKSVDTGPVVPIGEALLINTLLLSMFAIQHSGMARRAFKRWWTQYVSPTIERSTYVLFSSLVLIGLFVHWRPIPTVVWEVAIPEIAIAVQAVSLLGVVLVLVATFLINHFELFGLHQVFNNLIGREMPPVRFKEPGLYKVVRHPLYLGFIVAFWAAPVMTVGHLMFAAVTTAYILIAIMLEERDLMHAFGDDYRRYRQRVSMLIPFWRSTPEADVPREPLTPGARAR